MAAALPDSVMRQQTVVRAPITNLEFARSEVGD